MKFSVEGIRVGEPNCLNKVVNHIFDQIDVKRIQRVMELLNWKWAAHEPGSDGKYHDHVPTKKEMKDCVGRLIQDSLYQALRDHEGKWQFTATGGFNVALMISNIHHPFNQYAEKVCDLDIDVSFVIEGGVWYQPDVQMFNQ